MTLTQQFLLLAIIPAAFLALIWYGRRTPPRPPRLAQIWSLTLLLMAVWASSLLSYFGGTNLPLTSAFTWRGLGTYALALWGSGLLLTTLRFLEMPLRSHWWALLPGGLLWLGAAALDPAIWTYRLPTIFFRWRDGGVYWRHFDIWAGVWVLSGLLPAILAWRFSLRLARRLPQSHFRNQLTYWFLALSLFLAGMALSFTRVPGQLGWPQLGALICLLAAVLGTLSLAGAPLPNIRLSGRQVVALLADAGVVFLVVLLGIWFFSQQASDLGGLESASSQLLAAALFTILLLLSLRLAQQAAAGGRQQRRWARSAPGSVIQHHLPDSDPYGALFDPETSGRWLLLRVQTVLHTEDPWLFTTEDGPDGRLLLRPLARARPLTTLSHQAIPTLSLDSSSPFARQLRQQAAPIVQYDVDTVSAFAEMHADERLALRQLQRHLYMPLHAGTRLVGVLALAAKNSRRPYDRFDYLSLQTIASQAAPLLQQALSQATLYHAASYAFEQYQTVTYTSRYQTQLQALYGQFLDLLQPEFLRQPLLTLDEQVRRVQQQYPEADLSPLQETSSHLRQTVDAIIGAKIRLEQQADFAFAPVQLDRVLRDALDSLAAMAEGRRVQIETAIAAPLPAIRGDRQRLQEAMRHLLHNAIKFNRIGGQVTVTCRPEGNEIAIHISDTGVGIPADRLDDIWMGFRRSPAPKTAGANGLRLGLPLARFIVLSHGGRIMAASDYGSGSTFSLYLPISL